MDKIEEVAALHLYKESGGKDGRHLLTAAGCAVGDRALVTRAVRVKQIIQPTYLAGLNPAERIFAGVRQESEERSYANLDVMNHIR